MSRKDYTISVSFPSVTRQVLGVRLRCPSSTKYVDIIHEASKLGITKGRSIEYAEEEHIKEVCL